MDYEIEIVFTEKDIEVLLTRNGYVESTAYISRAKILKFLFGEVE